MKLTATEMNRIATLLAKADREDLNRIADMHKAQSRRINSKVASKFNVGDKVQFNVGDKVQFDAGPSYGGIITGTVIKVNPKNIKLDCGPRYWNVTATLLKKV